MKKEEDNINALDELHKGSCMGVDALNIIIEKAETKNFKKDLIVIKKKYERIRSKIDIMYSKYSDDKPHSTSLMTKAMTWSGVEMKTMKDESVSKLSELLLNGINMGIIEGKKILNNKKINKEVKKITQKFVDIQEESAEYLQSYL